MSTTKNRRWILQSRPKPGPINQADFRFEEQQIPELKEGEFKVRNNFLSFDPSQRFWMERDSYVPKVPLGEVMRAMATGEVVESLHPDFPAGAKVAGAFGWQDYAISDGNGLFRAFQLPPGVSEEAALSVFGMTGLTGYFGMTEIGRPMAGETVLVSGASGATGSIAAQVAKNLGARVIGIAGGPQKCEWLTKTAKIDAAIDYKSQDLASKLNNLAPKGVDVYFDNVGGRTLDTVLLHLSAHARVVLCGAIAAYDGTKDAAISNYLNLVLKRASITGFLITDYVNRFADGIIALAHWVGEGKMHYEVDVQQGLENAPETLQRLFDGKNFGKQLLRL